MSSPVSYTLDGTTAVVQMDDSKANALSAIMIEGIVNALERAEKEATGLILTGRPDRFCGGFDMKTMMSSPEAGRALLRQGADMLMKLYGAAVPIVVACTGHALAGGALILLSADVRVGAAGAFRIGLNEVAIGLPLPVLAMELARDRLMPTELGRATLQARVYDPERAVQVGYLDEVVPSDDLLARAKTEAARLGALRRNVFKATKKRLRGGTIAHIIATFDEDIANIAKGGE